MSVDILHVGKTFGAGTQSLTVLEDINLSIPKGKFIGVVGASGCGKSTLLRLIAGLDRDFTGSIHINGRSVDGPCRDRAIVFQDHRLYPWLTVHDNIGLGIEELPLTAAQRNQRIHALIELVGLRGFDKIYPAQLSGGMAQRAAIARALIAEPDILLMDEPLGALDSLTRSYLQDELLRIWEDRRSTAIIVTHDVEEAVFLCDTVVVMAPRPGRIEARIDVPVARPRDRSAPEFVQLKKSILQKLIR
ncbi:MAG: ABC transporter ATP-binding protein [Burkholderiaceae bacterium]|jgi:ABC-type nitrate/sulfonate/bicarbonate transport system ATPase subunit|nr:ABC transporter ATP-binding protein [Burkholderiaceae bacterium]